MSNIDDLTTLETRITAANAEASKAEGAIAQLQAQGELAQLLMTPTFQAEFNRVKGSIPALTNPDMSKFDRCAVRSYQDFLLAEKQDNLLPSMAEGMATPTNMRQAIMDVLSNYFNDPKANPQQTALHLERAMRSTR